MNLFIMLNTKLKTTAKNDFKKDFFQLMKNSIFGKTMENFRNYDYKPTYIYQVWLKPSFKDDYLFPKVISCGDKKTKIRMNKPVYLQQIVLDLSKTFMCEFHYNYIQPKDGSATKLHHMDTNSFAHETETEDFYNNIAKEAEARFDTRGYSQDDKRPLPIGTNHL